MESNHISKQGKSYLQSCVQSRLRGARALNLAGIWPGGLELGRSPVIPFSIFKEAETLSS